MPGELIQAGDASSPQIQAAALGAPNSKPKKFSLKKLAWRVSAAAFWLWWVGRLIIGSRATDRLASGMREHLTGFLSSVGFAPVHSEYLGTMLKYGWLLTIVGFRPLELVGLGIYIAGAPIWLALYYLFKDVHQDFNSDSAVKIGLRPIKVRRPAITTVGLLLLGWFLLYGETDSRGPLLAAAFLSGALFFLLTGRALQRVRPIEPGSEGRASWMEKTGLSALNPAQDALSKIGTCKKKSELAGTRWAARKWKWIFRQAAVLLRGQQAKNRLYQWLLADYVVSFLVLGAAANLFWAVVAKIYSSFPKPSLHSLILICVNYFLPNAGQAPLQYGLPVWARLAPAITAFILFVLFVGAAASLLPSRYNAYATRLDNRYLLARRLAVRMKQASVLLDKASSNLPR